MASQSRSPSWAERQRLRRLRSVRRLMVVAHPDDETLWGGVTLASGHDWGVICLTNRDSRKRRSDFSAAIGTLGARGAIFDIPDRGGSPASAEDLERIRGVVAHALELVGLKEVMTHGPDGEYGHPFHRTVSEVVTDVVSARQSAIRLRYFNFDPAIDATASPVWDRKESAILRYLGPPDRMLASDLCHYRVSMHEAPVDASAYSRPLDFIFGAYADSGMDIT